PLDRTRDVCAPSRDRRAGGPHRRRVAGRRPDRRPLSRGSHDGRRRPPPGRVLGCELADAAPDRVVVRLPFRSEVTTVGDLVHGGAIGALVDVTATAAASSDFDLGRCPRGTTISLTINYLNGARGCDLTATGTIAKRGKSIVV